MPMSSGAFARPQDDSNEVPPSLLRKLTQGVNITRWFCYLNDADQEKHFQTYFKSQDYANLKQLGIRYVRLCISPDVILDGDTIRPKALAAIDKAVDELMGQGLAVIWDLHDNGQMKLDDPSNDNSRFLNFWINIAEHYKGAHENNMVFELVNEPVFLQNPEKWFLLQRATVKAVRAVDRSRTIMVSSNSWSGIDNLAKLPFLPEKNLIYTVHCYDPFFFTHEGATWAGDAVKPLKHMPFPSSPEAVAKMIDQIPEASQGLVRDYGAQKYDTAYLVGRLQIAHDWAAAHHVPILLGEFGAYPLNALPEDRERWFQSMRIAIDKLHMRNCLWGYDDGFGLGRTENSDGSIQLDPVATRFYAK